MSTSVISLITLLLLQTLAPAEKNPHTATADVAHGKRIFAAQCAGCHGPTGDGGKGTNLAVPVLPRAAADASLYEIIRFGIPDSEMPSHMLTPREVWQVAAFVRTLGASGAATVAGNASRGRELVRGKAGCLACHAVDGEGGHGGPPLNGIGARRSAGWLRSKLLDPAAEVPMSFRTAALTTRSGQKLSGLRLNEDTWSIQLRDPGGRLHSFWKSDLTDLKYDRQTTMPSYRDRLAERELDDVVAYLSRLRGAQ
jgi:putative heme-binding domain-containing protein